MTNPASGEKIECSEELRDKIFEYLPPQARAATGGVEVRFWPHNHGEMMLRLTFEPSDRLLDLDATEEIYGPDEKISGSYVRGAELDATTGEILGYGEYITTKEHKPFKGRKDWDLIEAENDATQFDQGRLDFLLNLFDNI
jgi:hypothetical protein